MPEGSEGINPYMHDYIHTHRYIYISKGERGIITHSCYEPYLIIGQLVNGQFWEIQDQILLLRRHTKEKWK